MKKYIVTLTADERRALSDLISAGKASALKLAHARILLMADAAEHGEAQRGGVVLRERDDRGRHERERAAHDRDEPGCGAFRGGIAGIGHGDLFRRGNGPILRGPRLRGCRERVCNRRVRVRSHARSSFVHALGVTGSIRAP